MTNKITLLILLGIIISCKQEAKKIKPVDEKTNKNLVIDSLRNFAFKGQWISIRTTNQKKIADIIELKNYEYRNWSSGLKGAHWDKRMVYISPVINDEWVFVIGYALPYCVSNKLNPLLQKLSTEFNTVNYYSKQSDRYNDLFSYGCVSKWEKDSLIRFVHYRESGNIDKFGKMTLAEKEIGLKGKILDVKYDSGLTRLNQKKPEEFKLKYADLEYSSEVDGTIYVHNYVPWIDNDFFYELSEKWDINPNNIDDGINKSTGLGLYGQLFYH